MQECAVVRRFLRPADEDAPKAVHPPGCAFAHPAPRSGARCRLAGLGLFAPRADMGREAERRQDSAYFLVVVAFVQTQALRLLRRGRGPLCDAAFARGAHQFHGIRVGASHGQPAGYALARGQPARFDSVFAAVGGRGSGFFATQRGVGPGPGQARNSPGAAWPRLELRTARWPEPPKPGCPPPRRILIVRRRMRHQCGLLHRRPLAASA